MIIQNAQAIEQYILKMLNEKCKMNILKSIIHGPVLLHAVKSHRFQHPIRQEFTGLTVFQVEVPSDFFNHRNFVGFHDTLQKKYKMNSERPFY